MEFEELRKLWATSLVSRPLPYRALFWNDGPSLLATLGRFTRETEVRLKCTSGHVDMRSTLERRFNRFSGMTAHK